MKILLFITLSLSLSGMAHAKGEKTRRPANQVATLEQAKTVAHKIPGAILGLNGQDNEYSAHLELADGTTLDINPVSFVQLINSVCDLKAYISIVGSRVAFCTAK